MTEQKTLSDKNVESVPGEADHLKLAAEMADLITRDFDPMIQNEIIMRIFNIVKDRRCETIESASKQLAYIQDSLNKLQQK